MFDLTHVFEPNLTPPGFPGFGLLELVSLSTPDLRVVLVNETALWPDAVQKASGGVRAAYLFNLAGPHRAASILPCHDCFYLYSRAAQHVDDDTQGLLVLRPHSLVETFTAMKLECYEQFAVGPEWENEQAYQEYSTYVQSYDALVSSLTRTERELRRW